MLRLFNAKWVLPALIAIASLLIGFVSGRSWGPDRRANVQEDAAARKLRESSGNRPSGDERHPDLATIRVEELAHIPPSELAEVLEHCSPRELAQLAQRFNSFPPNPNTYANLKPFFKIWAQSDEQSAFKSAVALTDHRTQEMAIEAIVSSASPDGAGRIAQLMRDQPESTFREGVKEQLYDSALVNWSQTSPAAAAEFILENPALRETSASKVLRNFGWIEGPAAIKWLNDHPGTNDYTANTEWSEALLGWIEKDPRVASTYISDHLDEGKIRECISSAASGLFYCDKGLALQWPQELPAGDNRDAAILQIARVYADADPRGAAAWVVGFPEKTGIEGLNTVISQWTREDANAALEWINHSAGARRDEALALFCSSLSSANPDKAMETVNNIFDPALRIRTMEDIIRNVPASASGQTKRWIESSLLSREQKAYLLARIPEAQTR
jgi:hypothetical protein